MPEIRFGVDGESFTVRVDTIDPNDLYSSGDRVVDEVEAAGYQFKPGEEPDRVELALLGRDSPGADIDLGDISDRVERGVTAQPEPEPEPESDPEPVPASGPEPAPEPAPQPDPEPQHDETGGDTVDDMGGLSDTDDTAEGRNEDVQHDPADPGEVAIELVAPDGTGETKVFNDGQNLGAVTSRIQLNHDVDMSREVKLYRDEDRTDELSRGTLIEEVDSYALYWDTAEH